MPSSGGAAGKAGDQYEALWTVDAAIRVILGDAEHVTYESLDPQASRGVEFNLKAASSTVEFWSIKRQTAAAAGWTLSLLTKIDDQGRSILSDLIEHVERDDLNVAVFGSTLGAAKLEELRSVADDNTKWQQRLADSQNLRSDYEKYLLPLFDQDEERARFFLTRLLIRTADDGSLRTYTESTISLLFYNVNGGAIDPAATRLLLAEFMLDNMHKQINRDMILAHLAAHGIKRKDWKVDTRVRDKIAGLCETYTKPLREQLIGGSLQILPGADKLLGDDGLPSARWTVISGGAGAGKSVESAEIVERLRAADVPVLPVRMDLIDESIMTPTRLGESLSLPTSPVAVLAGLADGGDCVLVIDQLDAISLASGRRADLWVLFERIMAEVDCYPNLRVIVVCRAFDLEHDHRMQKFKDDSSAYEICELGSFEPKTVDDILGERVVHAKLKPLLIVPLHLAMFLSLPQEGCDRLETRDQLFAAFWTEKQRSTSRRLDRSSKFVEVVDRLATWLSDRQELSAPEPVLDELREDADALASEHVIVLADGRYRFFHESFFDYAFARRFSMTGGKLLNLLLSDEQHLFRRAQVRQILSFLRTNDPPRYLSELRAILDDGRIRFHIKRVVFQFLSALEDPTQAEWSILHELSTKHADLLGHVNRVIANHVGWFDTVDAADYFDAELSCGDVAREQQAIWFCAMPQIMEHRSDRVAGLLINHRREDDDWTDYLRHICRNGQVYHSREMFDLFLSLIRDGTLDGARPNFAVNDNWWSTLYSMAKDAPAMACEAIAEWFDRKLTLWREEHPDEQPAEEQATKASARFQSRDIALGRCFEEKGGDHSVIANAAKEPLVFAEHFLPRIADLVAEYAKPCRDRLEIDPVWSFRAYGDNRYSEDDIILGCLASSLESLAQDAPADLDRLFAPYLERPHDTISYLVLRAWAAVPETYADRLAQYLAKDPRRLKVGYASWSGDSGAGMAEGYRSIEAVRAASQLCTDETLANLEGAILSLQDEWESQHPHLQGLRQLQLLSAVDGTRLHPAGRAKLLELQAKFPEVTNEPPEAMEVRSVGSPIPDEDLADFTNDDWLRAMHEYAGVDRRNTRDISNSGGERELARALGGKAKATPKRFIALAQIIPTTLPGSYFEEIIRGIADIEIPDGTNSATISILEVVALLERAHEIQERPCGRAIAHLIGKWSKVEWPPSITEIITWYAVNDPDPEEELWRKRASGGDFFYGGDPEMAGLNSTRGAAADAIARLLYDRSSLSDKLLPSIKSLVHDASIGVRTQAAHCLLALLNVRPDLAIPWFVECVSIDQAILGTRFVERFAYYAGRRDYSAIRPVIQSMLACDDEDTVEAGARLTCLIALDVPEAEEDAAQVRAGIPLMRAAAATIYASNIAQQEVGALCRELLVPLFKDTEEHVQEEAATAFRHITDLETADQGKLLEPFLLSNPGPKALEPVIRELEDSPVRLPDLVCRLVEIGVKAFYDGAGDIRTHSSMIAMDLSKIVIRLYTQSEDEAIRKRCLDSIDVMERAGFFGLADELGKIER